MYSTPSNNYFFVSERLENVLRNTVLYNVNTQMYESLRLNWFLDYTVHMYSVLWTWNIQCTSKNIFKQQKFKHHCLNSSLFFALCLIYRISSELVTLWIKGWEAVLTVEGSRTGDDNYFFFKLVKHWNILSILCILFIS